MVLRKGELMPIRFKDPAVLFRQVRRHAPYDLSGFTFDVAKDASQKLEAYRCRAQAYRRYFLRFEDCIDTFDERARIYLCRENRTGAMVGSLRSVSSQTGPLELESWFDLGENHARGFVFGEASRFSVPHHPKAFYIKLGLWKLLYHDLAGTGNTHLLAWVRDGARPDYETLLFEDYPASIHTFNHPRLLGRLHHVLLLELATTPARFQAVDHPLHDFFFVDQHPNILVRHNKKAAR